MPDKFLTVGSSGREVQRLNEFLHRYGYLEVPRAKMLTVGGGGVEISSFSTFTHNTAEALRHYQRNFHLPETGEYDQATATVMSMPRCGLPDVTFYRLLATWPSRFLTYAINNTPTGLTLN